MKSVKREYDSVIIGGGFFGLYTANFLSSLGMKIAIIEMEDELFSRASKINQSRIHNGYHYPRSRETAKKVSFYYERFCEDFNFALVEPFKQFYCLSKHNSKVSVEQFVEFCKDVNIPLKQVKKNILLKDGSCFLFETKESCFDYHKIKEHFSNLLEKNKNIDIYLNAWPTHAENNGTEYVITLNRGGYKVFARSVFNLTYGGVNHVNKIFGFPEYELKYELCQLLLCKTDKKIFHMGITVMDGPFFSIMPFGNGGLVTVSSVEHSPINVSYLKAQQKLREEYAGNTSKDKVKNSLENSKKILSVADSFLRKDVKLKYMESMFEIKPILIRSEIDDSRPTIVSLHSKKPYFISVLAGKISTVYDLDNILGKIK